MQAQQDLGAGARGLNRLVIATPVDGAPHAATVSYVYHTAVRQLERSGACIMSADIFFADDLARARSRAVWYALNRGDWEWLLFWDEDVCVPQTGIVPRMIEIASKWGYDVIGAPYPRKRIPAAFPYKPLASETGQHPVIHDCIEVDLLAAGFLMISRSCLERMVAHYAETEWFTDGHDPNAIHETVALFRQVRTDETTIVVNGETRRYRELYSEDYSFCHRWRQMGGRVHMFVGAGAPLGHIGGHLFEGTPQELGNVR